MYSLLVTAVKLTDAASAAAIREQQEQSLIVAVAATVAVTMTFAWLEHIERSRQRRETRGEAAESGGVESGMCDPDSAPSRPSPPPLAEPLAPNGACCSVGVAESYEGLECWAHPPDVPPIVQAFTDDPQNKLAAQIAEHGQALPDFLAPENCAACGRKHEAICFLCPTCQLLAPPGSVQQVFDTLDEGELSESWKLAEAVIRDVNSYLVARGKN